MNLKKLLLMSWIVGGVALAGIAGEPLNAFRPGEIWLDTNGVPINAHAGGILLFQKTYYWFGQHMVEGDAGNYAQVGVHVYSSKDLYNWKDDGIALKVSDDPKSDITKGCILERPKVIYNAKTRKFVMWFHLELKGQGYGAARVGVATADQPTGPYSYVESFRPDAGQWPQNVTEADKDPGKGGPLQRDFQVGQMSRDMTLFVDDDGKAYHITASEENQTLHISLLSDDFLHTSGKYVRIFPGRMNEAPAMFKFKDKYYLITSNCNGWNPTDARLAVADSIWGPWKELGNPWIGTEDQRKISFDTQSTYIIAVPVFLRPGTFIFMADRWRPKNAIDGRYIWLPIQFRADGTPFLQWMDHWDMGLFKPSATKP